MSKKMVSLVLVFLVLLSSFSVAAQNSSTCSGFWGSISCFLWGSGRGIPTDRNIYSSSSVRSIFLRNTVVGEVE